MWLDFFTVNIFLRLTFKILSFLRLTVKFLAVLRLTVNPIETLLAGNSFIQSLVYVISLLTRVAGMDVGTFSKFIYPIFRCKATETFVS